ncbi:DUF3995 domain-containing protein [Dyadobacter jejuensis]|uniref:DUF3995 domain-containing protein n=1 Tax=Dyadobacter jejuensis TaxID=1082580 RepID=UPI000D6D4C0B|nr:DUF3995 domain-containing protein [Dyadobacter jejuensis]
MILSILLSIVFFLLGAIHFHWVFGGTFGYAASLPTTETGERVLNPKKIDSALVGTALISFGIFYWLEGGLSVLGLPTWVSRNVGWIIPWVFLMRAIGDFKYVGLFKKVKHTDFGRLDTRLFSPLCLGIAVVGLWIQWG